LKEMTTAAPKTITPTLDDDSTRCYPDWFKATMLVSMSCRDADGINGLLVHVLTPAQWANHPTNIAAADPPVVIRAAPTWPIPVAPAGAAPNALVSAYERHFNFTFQL
jgi:hypothetical protein